MTSSYRVLPAADTDLDDQAAYLAREASLEIALRFYDAAAASFEQIARMPGLGERRQTANSRLEGLRVCASRDSRSISSFTGPSRTASRSSASCTVHGISIGSSNRKTDPRSPARPRAAWCP